MTPQNIENKWDFLERKAALSLASMSGWLPWLSVALLALIFRFAFWNQWIMDYPDWARFNLNQDRTWLTIPLIGLSLFVLRIPVDARPLFFISVLFSVWTWSCYRLGVTHPGLLFYPAYIFGLGLVLRWKDMDPSRSRQFWGLAYVVLGFFGCMYMAGYLALRDRQVFLPFFWVLHPEYILLAGISWMVLKPASTWVAWAPSLLPNPIPLPSTVVQNATLELWWKGFLNICLGLALLRLNMFLAFIELPKQEWITGLHHYFYFCCYIIAVMNITAGLLRLYGFQVPDATRFLFLATSPTDVWRRGSVYLYQFMLDTVYFPVLRKWRSVWLANLVSAAVILLQMFFLHEIGVRIFYSLIFPEFSSNQNFTLSVVIWALRYLGVWIAVIATWEFITRKMKLKPVWTGVILTQLICLMITIYVM
jgi:hypothetical protein